MREAVFEVRVQRRNMLPESVEAQLKLHFLATWVSPNSSGPRQRARPAPQQQDPEQEGVSDEDVDDTELTVNTKVAERVLDIRLRQLLAAIPRDKERKRTGALDSLWGICERPLEHGTVHYISAQCSTCGRWVSLVCAGIAAAHREMIDKMPRWVCPVCSGRTTAEAAIRCGQPEDGREQA